MSIYLGIVLLVFRYYRNNINRVYYYFGIALSLCIYVNFVHLLTHPMLWVLEGQKDAAGYLLGNNYNQMGCRMMIALATSVLCTKYSKFWIINSIVLGITCIITLLLVKSMTSLSMIIIFLVYCLIPSSKLRKVGIYSLLTVLVLFQVFVVFNGNGLENNEFAVYIVNDILQKDITFTHRTDMWDSAMRVIIESPIWGWGFVKEEWFTSHMSSFAYGPHNFILSLFIFGGVLLFAVFIMIVYYTIISVKAYINERIGQYVIFSAVCLYFMGLMEMYPFTIMFYILIVMYYYQYTDKKITTIISVPIIYKMKENTNKAIVVNSLILYIRLAIISVCGLLYTRFSLQALGADDYGLFSVIACIITFASIINTIMIVTSNRYIAMAIGKGDINEACRTFNTNLVIHLFIALFTV